GEGPLSGGEVGEHVVQLAPFRGHLALLCPPQLLPLALRPLQLDPAVLNLPLSQLRFTVEAQSRLGEGGSLGLESVGPPGDLLLAALERRLVRVPVSLPAPPHTAAHVAEALPLPLHLLQQLGRLRSLPRRL